MSRADDVTRPFPHAVGAEKSVLSTMLQDAVEYIGLAVELGLRAEHFYQPHHQILFGLFVEKTDSGEPVEFVSLIQELLDTGRLEAMGGASAVTDIYTYAPSPGHFRHHVKIIKDKFAERSLLNFCVETESAVWDAPGEVEQMLDRAEAGIMAIRESRESVRVESLKDAVAWTVNDFEERLRGKCEIQGLGTGFVDLDRMTGGLKPGDMFVIAARPSMGKTSLLMNIVEHLCIETETPGMVFSLEMTRRQLVQRMVYSRAKFDAGLLSRGYVPNKGDLSRFQRGALDVNQSPLVIDDMAGITISQLRAKARRQKRERGIGFIAVDYLQLMRSYSKQAAGSREREISEISSGLKGLAKELDVPVIVLAQLNRGPEGRSGKRAGVPRMSDLRESGSIEQDADLVALLYRHAYYAASEEEKHELQGRAELDLAKNRNGATGRLNLTFIPELCRFETGAPYVEGGPVAAADRTEGWAR